MNLKQSNGFQAWFLLILLAIIWGSSFILIKRAVTHLSPVHVASLRVFCASLFFLPVAISSIKSVPFKRLKYFLLSGTLGNFAPSFLFALSMPHMQSTVSGILNSLSPMFTLLTGALLWRQKFSYAKITGVLIGLGGCIVLIVFKGNSFQFDINYYALLVVMATMLYGLNTNVLKSFFQDVKPMQVASLSLLSVGPFAGIIFFSTGGWDAIWASEAATESAGYTVLLALVSSSLSLILFTRLIQITSAIFSASVTYLMPIVSIFWGFMDSELIGFVQILGMAIILFSVFLIRK